MEYSRILLKLSGESLAGTGGSGIDSGILAGLASQIGDVRQLGVEVGIVVGGGNFFRGARGEAGGIDRVTGDYMGMLATLMNALALQDAMEKRGLPARVQSALAVGAVCEAFTRRKALSHLEKGRVVIFACGTGNPFFTTDTAAALRAREIEADVLLKATKVDGVYDKDPVLHSDAVRFPSLTYREVLDRGLGVMDLTAVTVCMEGDIPIVVFNILEKENLKRVVLGEKTGTTVRRPR